MPGDSAGRPKGSTLPFVKRLLAKSPPVFFEGPLPALLSSQGCFALSCLRGKLPTQSSLPLMPMGTPGLLLPSPPTSLMRVSSLHCLCQTAWQSAFSLPFLLLLHIFSVGGLTGLVLSSASIQSLFPNPALNRSWFSSPSMKLFWFPALGVYTSTAPGWNTPNPDVPCPFQPFATLLSNCLALLCFLLPSEHHCKHQHSRAKLLCYQ